MAFIELGDQFIALQKGRWQRADDGRHFGLVVNDKEAARRALRDDAGVTTLETAAFSISVNAYDSAMRSRAALKHFGHGVGGDALSSSANIGKFPSPATMLKCALGERSLSRLFSQCNKMKE
jgi:hypothetical protein